jgi:AcrR family transcriptional regulator
MMSARRSAPNSPPLTKDKRSAPCGIDPTDPDPQTDRDTTSDQPASSGDECPPNIRRGRPSIAEAEALSGRILDASWDVLQSGGFEAFTFDRVARHAHIGKATIYSRFPGKLDLMRALLQRRIGLRTDHLRQQGSHLPIRDAFRLRAADVMKMLFSPDGVLMERLIDWLDQEMGEGQTMRAKAYRNAIDTISQTMVNSPDAADLGVRDINLAARLWIEGLIGHARLADTEGASSNQEIDRWASDYTRFYFAGLRAMAQDD